MNSFRIKKTRQESRPETLTLDKNSGKKGVLTLPGQELPRTGIRLPVTVVRPARGTWLDQNRGAARGHERPPQRPRARARRRASRGSAAFIPGTNRRRAAGVRRPPFESAAAAPRKKGGG